MDKETIKKQSLEVIEEVLPDLDPASIDTTASIRDDSELSLHKYESFDDVIESVEKKLEE